MMEVPGYVTATVLAASVIVPVLLAAMLRRPGGRADTGVSRVAGLALLTWLAVTSAVAAAGVYQLATPIPPIAAPLVIGIPGALIALWRSPSLRARLDDPRVQANIVAVQVWRVVGVTFLILMILGELPPLFAIPAGLGDIAAGIAALFVASRLHRPGGRRWGVGWNVFGLADLIMAVVLGATTTPGAVRIFQTVPSSEVMTAFPMALVPTFLVPLSMVLHIVSLRYLLRTRAAARGALVDAQAHAYARR